VEQGIGKVSERGWKRGRKIERLIIGESLYRESD
jgi:hypothetical protein